MMSEGVWGSVDENRMMVMVMVMVGEEVEEEEEEEEEACQPYEAERIQLSPIQLTKLRVVTSKSGCGGCGWGDP
jgi:hypothetical protein